MVKLKKGFPYTDGEGSGFVGCVSKLGTPSGDHLVYLGGLSFFEWVTIILLLCFQKVSINLSWNFAKQINPRKLTWKPTTIVERPFRSISLFNMRGWCFQRLFQSFVFGGVLGIFGVPQPLKQCKLSIQFYGNQPYIKLFPLWTSVLAGSTRCMYIHSSPATCCATPRLTVERSPLAYSLASICFFSTCWDSAFPKLTERSMRISPEADLFVTSVQKKRNLSGGAVWEALVFLFFSH